MKSAERGVGHFLCSFKYSLAGLGACFRDEAAFRQECALAIPHFAGIFLCPLSVEMRLYLAALWFVLITVELLNTAIEAVVNLVSPEWNALAKKAKDCASAAVFSMISLLILSWGVAIFGLLAK